MSDDDRFLEEDVTVNEDAQSGKKVGLLPALVISILKWAALVLSAVIFIVTVVVITVNILSDGRRNTVYTPASREYAAKEDVLQYYDNIGEIRSRTSDATPHTVLVHPNIGFDSKNKTLQTELIQRTPQLRDLVRSYFSSKREADLHPSHEEALKKELRDKINNVLKTGKVQRVIFPVFHVVPM